VAGIGRASHRLKVMCCLAITASHVDGAFAGGPYTNGVATRAQSLQNAFTAIADDASAVYYNPSGLADLRSPEVLVSGIYVAPSISYTAVGGGESFSNRSGAGLSAFVAYPLEGQWVVGVGLYGPVARSTSFPESIQLGNTAQSSETLRIDFAAMASRSWGPVSLGLGPVLSYGRYESSILGFNERGTGTGLSFQVGTKWAITERLAVGLVYRAPTEIHLSGTGQLPQVGEGSFTVRQRYPSVIDIGLAWQPQGMPLRISFDVEHQNWSEVSSFNRSYGNPVLDSIAKTRLDAKDSIVLRAGVSWKSEYGEWRTGCSYSQAAVGPERMVPAQPDFDIASCSIGFGYKFERAELSVGVERQEMSTRTKVAPPFPGTYRMHVNSLLVGGSWSF